MSATVVVTWTDGTQQTYRDYSMGWEVEDGLLWLRDANRSAVCIPLCNVRDFRVS